MSVLSTLEQTLYTVHHHNDVRDENDREPGEDDSTVTHHGHLVGEHEGYRGQGLTSFCHQPVDGATTRLYCTDYRNDITDEPGSIADTVAFQRAVATEDSALLQRIGTKAVPLVPALEYHSKADRITLEMRRMLADLVAEAGAEAPD